MEIIINDNEMKEIQKLIDDNFTNLIHDLNSIVEALEILEIEDDEIIFS